MAALENRPNTALLVIDMQQGVVADAHEVDRVTATIAALVDRARAAGVPVVWVQHNDDELPRDSEGWRYVPELRWTDQEPVVHKQYGDSFMDTDLEEQLAVRGVGRLVVTGAQTDACIRSTLHGALVRGYDTMLVEDAHTTEDMRPWGAPIGPAEAIAYTNMYWSFSSGPDRRGSTVAAADVDFAPA